MKYGILLDDSLPSPWRERCLERLREVAGIELVLCILADVDVRRDVSVPATAKVVRVTTDIDEDTRVLDQVGEAAIADAQIDALLLLSRGLVRGRFVSTLRFGAWAFSFGNAAGVADVVSWALLHGERTTEVRLARLCADPGHEIRLRSGVFRVHRPSVARTVREISVVSNRWPAQVFIDVLNAVGSYVDGSATDRSRPAWSSRRRPSLRERLRYAASIGESARRRIGCSVDWSIGVVHSRPLEIIRAARLPAAEWVSPRPGTYFADPFPFERDGRRYVFFEEFDKAQKRGAISVTELDEYGRWSAPMRVIVAPHHLSYPFIVEEDGRVYCVPECRESRKVTMYVADPFPWAWRPEAVLIDDFAAVDSTLVRHDGRWWLFCTNYDEGDCTSLWLFHAPHLLGPWEPHRNNPVKTDVTSSRPGGPLFYDGTTLYRPAQDCSEGYGGRLVIHRVAVLSTFAFREEALAVIGPDPSGDYPGGVHTIAGCGDWSVIDGKRVSHTLASMYAQGYDLAAHACRNVIATVIHKVTTALGYDRAT